MSKEVSTGRLSFIDGVAEEAPAAAASITQPELLPIFEEVVILVQTLEGPEEKVQKRLVGYKAKEA